MPIKLLFFLSLLLFTKCEDTSPPSDQWAEASEYLEDLGEDTAKVVRGVMDAFEGSFVDPWIDDENKKKAKKTIDANGNVRTKKRTLINPTQKEIEYKTIEELEDDEDDPSIITTQSVGFNLNHNSLSNHTFSSFGLTDPKNVNNTWLGTEQRVTGYVKSFFWVMIEISIVSIIIIVLFKAFGLKEKLKNTPIGKFFKSSHRRYDKDDSQSYTDEEEDDEEELKNIRNAIKRGERTKV
ncbi:unnamed protein product [Moneuplotes crassus]|uniref:Uncharacterized protein n=1 Tax=Euplotes crassus TaxID=5936 RepID=A0AAD2CXS1_EUPCR|nr:unnamed protein product [Moneuplotes crassus]